MKLFPRRALVALGTLVAAVGATLGVAVPAAHALTITQQFTETYSNANGSVTLKVGTDDSGTLRLWEDASVTNYVHDGAHCIDAITDIPLSAHRPADLFPNCVGGNFDSGWLPVNWGRQPNNSEPVYWSDVDLIDGVHYGARVAVCDVDVVPGAGNHLERDTTTCASKDSNHVPGVVANHNWTGFSYATIQAIPCGTGCTYDLRPQYISVGHVDLASNTTLYAGDMQVSWDETHRMVMQGDGNLVLYTYNNTATWASSWCGAGVVSGNHEIVQSDGNLVIRDSSNNVRWSDVNDSTCAHGGYGGSGPFSIMQNDGNYVIYPAPGQAALWSTGTSGR